MSLNDLSEGTKFLIPNHSHPTTEFTHCGEGIEEGMIFVTSIRTPGKDMSPDTEVVPV